MKKNRAEDFENENSLVWVLFKKHNIEPGFESGLEAKICFELAQEEFEQEMADRKAEAIEAERKARAIKDARKKDEEKNRQREVDKTKKAFF